MSWQQLAKEEAARQNCPLPIVLATVEAETSGTNITGDSGNALGYGQVWAKWHMDSFKAAGKLLNLSVPTNYSQLTQFTLSNDRFSMAVAVHVIHKMWNGVGHDWAQFTYSYVGPGIPSSDFKRRKAIWDKYNNSSYDYTGGAQAAGSTTRTTVTEAKPYYDKFTITSRFAEKRSTGSHGGIDLAMPKGTPLLSVCTGTVTQAGDRGTAGYAVSIKDAEGYVHEYFHMSKIEVRSGQTVHSGEQIGLSGGVPGEPGAGRTTGAHLHFQTRNPSGTLIDPAPWLFKPLGGVVTTAGGSADSGIYDTRNDIVIPQTNMEVVEGSLTKGNYLYFRQYRIIVADQEGKTALDVSELHCTFNIVKNYLMEPNYSEVTIYNMSAGTEHVAIMEGYRVIVEAGYQGALQYGCIFDGYVVQVIREKDGTDYKVTLVALDSDQFLVAGTASFTMMRGANARQFVDQLVKKSSVSAPLHTVTFNMPDIYLARGKTVWGMTSDYLRQIARSTETQFYMEDGAVNIVKANDYADTTAVELNPQSGLIGVPAQQEYGASIKMLLNPRVKLYTFLHVDNSLIRNEKFELNQALYPLDQDGLYRVIKLTHTGDTRGNDWYTECETVTQAGTVPGLLNSPDQNMY